jgi:hypothetical protein
MFRLFIALLCFLVVSCEKAKPVTGIEKYVKYSNYGWEGGVGGQVEFRDENGEITIDRAESGNKSLKPSVVVTVIRLLDNNKRILIRIDENGNVERSEE